MLPKGPFFSIHAAGASTAAGARAMARRGGGAAEERTSPNRQPPSRIPYGDPYSTSRSRNGTASNAFGDDAARDAFEAPILEAYEREGNPYYATARLGDDGIIDPLDTRRVLSMGIELAVHAPIPETTFGVIRMQGTRCNTRRPSCVRPGAKRSAPRHRAGAGAPDLQRRAVPARRSPRVH